GEESPVSEGPVDIEALEEQLTREPGSEGILEQLLSAYATEALWNNPKRYEYVLAYVARFPCGFWARTPLVRLRIEASPEMWRRIETEWLRHFQNHPSDAAVARGFAWFLAETDNERAIEVLCAVASTNPNDAALYTDMGAICVDPVRRLEYYREAKRLG